MAALFGRPAEINKAGSWLLDCYFGLGAVANYNLSQIQPKAVIDTRMLGARLEAKGD